MFSLTTLPVHCCSTVFTEVTSLTSSTLVTWLAKRTYISEYYEADIQRRCAVQYVPQCYIKMYRQSHYTISQFEITYSTTVC